MHPRAEDFKQKVESAYGFDVDVHEFPEGTKTAADAAEAIGCSVEQIASGIVLAADGDLVVSITSGANRVSTEKIGVHGGKSSRAIVGGSVRYCPLDPRLKTQVCAHTMYHTGRIRLSR